MAGDYLQKHALIDVDYSDEYSDLQKTEKSIEDTGEEYFQDLISRRGANDPKKLEGLSEAKGLRTFLTLLESKSDKQWSLQIEHFLGSLLLTGSCLRVLAISGCNIIKFHESIGDLKYLKYLDLSFTQIEEIPDIDVSDAELKNKKFLSALNLVWASSHMLDDSQKDREVLAALKPHANLKELFVECYQATLAQTPCDSGFQSSEFYSIADSPGRTKPFRSLESLRFEFMSSLQRVNLTTLDEEAFQRLTFLEKLEISQCDNIMCLTRGLPTSLSYLSIVDCDLLLPRLQRETREDWPIMAHI
ncbi:LRR domain containing protein [Parasponia andersonii]|uniref:LRR domain containing protein n=1 Tax=Parasponia andersonii TaxID=3476 RepID=A0A2P5DM15_PARAD|nr:LRR domain containing protein [Parasponia andersonii]